VCVCARMFVCTSSAVYFSYLGRGSRFGCCWFLSFLSCFLSVSFSSKQYKVSPGDFIRIEKLDGKVGTSAVFNDVLFVSEPKASGSDVAIGKPMLSGGKIQGEIVGQGRGKKILIYKYRRRKDYSRTQGHRQCYTDVLITSIDAGGKKAALSDSDKKTKVAKFVTNLKAKGVPFTPKTLGSRMKMKSAKATADGKDGKTKPVSTPTKKARRKTLKKAAPKVRASSRRVKKQKKVLKIDRKRAAKRKAGQKTKK